MSLLFLTVQVMPVTHIWPKCDVVIYLKQEARDGILLSHFSCVRLCETPQTAAHQASRSPDSPESPQHHSFKALIVQHSAFFGEGNGTPLQYSCLENPMDGGAW